MRNIFLISILMLLVSGCGLFSDDPTDDPFDISITESFEMEFPFDASALCPPGQDCSTTPMPSPKPIDLPDVQIPIPIDILAATGSDELKEIAGRLKKVEIESVEYELVNNTLNINSPEFQIYVGPVASTQISGAGTVQLITIPSAPPKTSEKGTAIPKAESLPVASDLFKSLKFSAIGYVDEDVEKGELFPPQGGTTYKLKFNLRFTANPIDQF